MLRKLVEFALTQRLLANDGALSWASGNFSLQGRVLKWQTLQDVNAPIVPPYDRAPQFVGRYARSDLAGGLEAFVETDFGPEAVIVTVFVPGTRVSMASQSNGPGLGRPRDVFRGWGGPPLRT